MKKKIMQTFAVLVCAYGLLTVFSLYNLNNVENMLDNSMTINNEFYGTIVDLSDRVNEMQKLVAASFVYNRSDEINDNMLKIEKSFDTILEKIKIIQGPKFKELHDKQVEISENSDSSLKSSDDQKISVGDLISFLSTEELILKKLSLDVVESTKDILNSRKELRGKYEELSKTFRKIDFSQYLTGSDSINAKKQLNNLTRSVMVVMFSISVKDLNFVGRGKYEQAIKYWDGQIKNNKNYDEFKELFNLSFDLAIKNAANTSDDAFFKFNQSSYDFIKGIKKLSKYSDELFYNTQKDILADVSFTNRISVIISLLVLIMGSIFGWMTLDKLVESLKIIIAKVTKDSTSVASIASKVKASANTLSGSVSRQGSAIQETVSSMQEISSMISKTTDHSKTANMETHRLVESMADLKETNRNLKQLEFTFKTIENKTKVINDIVFKTQLLSFNASIEAARAGTHGKGFAVVAQEVGKLADLSGSAAEEINKLLTDSDTQIKETVEQTSDRIERFEMALNQVNKATESINQASHEQENGVRQTNSAMDQMDNATQENSENADELLDISIMLEDNSKNLQNATKELNEIVSGNGQNLVNKRGVLKVLSGRSKLINKKSQKNDIEISGTKQKNNSQDSLQDIDGDDDSFKPAV